MRPFFRRPHPWLMQALGGLIAVVVSVPLIVWLVVTAIDAKPISQVQTYAVPPSPEASSGAQSAQTPQTGVTGAGGPQSGNSFTVTEEPGKTPGTFVFSPSSLTIHVGDVVHWVDADSTIHNIVGSDATSRQVINRPAFTTAAYSVAFTVAGTYHYLCQIHPGMVGVIKVLPKGSGPSTGASTAASVTIKMEPGPGVSGYDFVPSSVTIKAGTTVKWVDVNQTPHNIVGTNQFSLQAINRTQINTNSYTVTFTKKGTYNYECQVHLPNMVGKIIVT